MENLFVDLLVLICRFPSGSDVVATVLLNTLGRIQENEKLPPKLNLWLDNCWRENKNRYTYIQHRDKKDVMVVGVISRNIYHCVFVSVVEIVLWECGGEGGGGLGGGWLVGGIGGNVMNTRCY